MNLTIEEAVAYSNIGENTLREYVEKHPNEDFIIHIGRKKIIKRKEFELWNERVQILK